MAGQVWDARCNQAETISQGHRLYCAPGRRLCSLIEFLESSFADEVTRVRCPGPASWLCKATSACQVGTS